MLIDCQLPVVIELNQKNNNFLDNDCELGERFHFVISLSLLATLIIHDVSLFTSTALSYNHIWNII